MKKLSLFTIFILLLIILSGRFNNDYPIHLINPFLKPGLKDVVENSLKGKRGNFAVSIKNLKTLEEYSLNDSQQFDAASLYKLWVMATVFKKIQTGELTEEKIISGDIGSLNQTFGLSSEDAELTEGSIDYTITEALEQMITISHNYAAFMLTVEVTNTAIKEFLSEYKFNNSSLGPPKTTSSDLAKFFEKLYLGQIVDPASSSKMLEILSRQKINDRIPKLLPEGTKVAHKTGDINFVENDGGIVFSPNGDYIIVVLSETPSAPTATEDIAELSSAVYDYFSK